MLNQEITILNREMKLIVTRQKINRSTCLFDCGFYFFMFKKENKNKDIISMNIQLKKFTKQNMYKSQKESKKHNNMFLKAIFMRIDMR